MRAYEHMNLEVTIRAKMKIPPDPEVRDRK